MTEEKGRVGKGNEKSGSARNEMSSFSMLKYVFVTPLLTQAQILYVLYVIFFQMIHQKTNFRPL